MRGRGNYFDDGGADDGGLINLTPLLDVLFVVLILFMLIAPLVDLDRVDLAPAKQGEKTDTAIERSCPIKIYVQNDGAIILQSKPFSLDDFERAMKEFYTIYPSEVPQLYFDQMAPFGLYQRIKNAIESAGFEALDVILKNEA